MLTVVEFLYGLPGLVRGDTWTRCLEAAPKRYLVAGGEPELALEALERILKGCGYQPGHRR